MGEQETQVIPQSESISEEQISKELDEQVVVMREILAAQEKEKTAKLLTNPSGPALHYTKHEAGETIGKVRKTVRQLFILYLTNQFVARAINARADTLVSMGYKIQGEDAEGIKACEDLIRDSGGTHLFWQLSVNTDIAGDGFLEKVYNQSKTKILRLKHVHPLTLSFKRDETTDKIIVGEDKEPVGYVQFHLDENGTEVETDVPKEPIAHLKFNSLGDEFTGVSICQSGYDTIVRLMNMEYSAAEAAVKTANPIIVAECNTKSPNQIAQWGQILGRINGRDQIFIPDGMKFSLLSPGTQNFSAYSEYFLNAVVATFGVPKSVLLGDSGGGNRSEGIVLTRHFYSGIRGNQHQTEQFFNLIFEEYADLAGFKAPKLFFEDIAEDATLMARSAIELLGAGVISVNEARQMIGLEPITGLGGSQQTQVVQQEVSTPITTSQPQGISADLKKLKRAKQFPASPGKAEGSQEGVKDKQRKSPFSRVSPVTK